MYKRQVPTRFGSIHDVIVRFLKVRYEVGVLSEEADSDSAKNAKKCFDEISRVTHYDNVNCYATLMAVKDCFSPLRHAQTQLEASNTPTIMLVLPMLESIKTSLDLIVRGVGQGECLLIPHQQSQLLAKITLDEINRINYHDMWAASCVLHPGLNLFSFMSHGDHVTVRQKGINLIRKMMKNNTSSVEQGNTSSSEIPVTTNLLGSQSFDLKSSMSFMHSRSNEHDELTTFLAAPITDAERRILENESGIVDFWIAKRRIPLLTHVALRIYPTPPSSSSSERDFSLLKLLLGLNKTSQSDENLSNKSYLRSTYNSEM